MGKNKNPENSSPQKGSPTEPSPKGSPTEPSPVSVGDVVKKILAPLASLKLTVALFAMAIFIVLAGTFAQTEKDIWQVVHDYFRIQFSSDHVFTSAFARIDFQIFFPPSFFPSKPKVPGYIYFPKGWLIGFVMAINLVSAHAVRFKIQTRGLRLLTGLGVIALGILVTWMVIVSGDNKDGMQQNYWVQWSTLWIGIKGALLCLWAAVVFGIFRLESHRKIDRWILISVALVLGILMGWLFTAGEDATLSDPSMRILWQLIKGTFAGGVLLAGCVLAFKKRAGIVLLHGGVGLMMFSELLVGTTAIEGQMYLREGETANYVQDIRTLELAIVDPSNLQHDEVVVVPKSVLLKSMHLKDRKIQHEDLPFDVEVVKYLRNSTMRNLKPDEANLATAGAGLDFIVVKRKPGAGTDTGGEVDRASAYVKLTGKDGAEVLGTYLMSQFLKPQKIIVGETAYDVQLRFKRTYKPYSVHLIDVRKDDYLGTNTPRNYSSDVRLVDESRNVDRDIKIWMNNPLRFAGETFYQSSYSVDPETGVEATTLQVVTNTGWMIPYVACMIVATGLLSQFLITLLRFLKRKSTPPSVNPTAERTEKNPKGSKGTNVAKTPRKQKRQPHWALGAVPWVVVLGCACYLGSKAIPPSVSEKALKIHEFGKLPVVYEGRVKPFDTLARNTLRIISNRQTFVDESGETQPAIVWLLDLISDLEQAEKHRVFRIENMEVLDTLGLERRSGFRYAVEEFRGQMAEFEKQNRLARSAPKENLSVYQRKILELDRRIRTYTLLFASFRPPPLPPLPNEEEFKKDPRLAAEQLERFRQAVVEAPKRLASMGPPLAVPFKTPEDTSADVVWEPFSTAWTKAYVQTRLLGQKPDPATTSLSAIFSAYAEGDTVTFNTEVAKYQAVLVADPPENVDPPKINFESSFNHFEPFYYSAVLYLFAFILTMLSMLGWTAVLRRSAFWLIAFTLVVHTAALIARIYISGRPPVTTLYSSAIFLGWGCVVLGLIIEMIFRLGIGNVVASMTGFAGLLIAHLLTTAVPSFRGDTFTVMQAVLDTQFWLATHVTCVTLGYATTFLAGFLGIVYILRGMLSSTLTQKVGKDLSRMIYGILCFAMFFSFVGTVLGGLWADDSWGRFWGWDPKENGALIIVLWNALILHARWGAMVKDRGLAVLAVFGNVVTSWSWFGVNELGIGLHSYGFTEGVLMALMLVAGVHLLIMAIGLMPMSMWWSFGQDQPISKRDARKQQSSRR